MPAAGKIAVAFRTRAFPLAMKPTRILLCNHHPIVRSGLRLLLEREIGFRVIGEAADGREAVILAEHTHPEIVLLDVHLPRINGMVAAREISSKDGNAGILFVTVDVDEGYVTEALKVGARGYVLADSAPNDLADAIRVVARGGSFLSPSITSQLLEEYARKHGSEQEHISEHEKELFCLLAEGYDDHEIARHLNTSVDAVKSDCLNLKSMLAHFEIPELMRHFMSVGPQHKEYSV